MSEKTIICRCEDITLEEIRELIKQGHHKAEELKRQCRCGMGHCQGRTCMPLIAREIAAHTGEKLHRVALPKHRPPTGPISLGALARGEAHE